MSASTVPTPGSAISHEPFSSLGQGPRAGTGVLLSHGFTGSPHGLRPWAQALAEAGFAVELPLLPGHGTSWQDMAGTSWRDWYQGYELAYERLATRSERIVTAGLSMGGCLALRLAALRPVVGTVVVNPALQVDDRRAALAGVLKHFVPTTASIANDILKPRVDEGAYARTPTAAVQQLRLLTANTRELLPQISTPVDVLRSSVDHIVSDASLERLRSGLAEGLLRVEPLHNSYHVATLDFDAPKIFAHSIAFIDSLTGSTQ